MKRIFTTCTFVVVFLINPLNTAPVFATAPYDMKVLSISYFPVIGDQLDTTETGITASLTQIRQTVSTQMAVVRSVR